MKTIKSISFLLLLFSVLNLNAQKLTEKQQEREDNKVEIFTSNEKDNLQRSFHEGVAEMKLNQRNEEEYFSIILYYAHKMGRLDDNDKENTPEEIQSKFEEYADKINTEVLPILTNDQFKIHIENFGKIIRSVSARLEKQ